MAEQTPPAPSGATDDPGKTPWRTALCTGRQKMKDGTEKVMLIILRDDTLQVATFLTTEQAEKLGEELLNTSAQIRTGLVIPPASRIQI